MEKEDRDVILMMLVPMASVRLSLLLKCDQSKVNTCAQSELLQC